MDDEKDFLQFLENSNIIDFTLIRQEYGKMKRQQILDQTKIWKASDGRWKAYVDVAGKRRLIAKSTRAALENEIIETYKDPKIKFKECFDNWLSEKLEYGEIQKQTYDRYVADYRRYIYGTELDSKEVKRIDELYLENFIKAKIAADKLTAKNWGNMRILISGAMIYAFSPSSYWISAIFALRLGSYSIPITVATTPSFCLLKSIILYFCLFPPPL